MPTQPPSVKEEGLVAEVVGMATMEEGALQTEEVEEEEVDGDQITMVEEVVGGPSEEVEDAPLEDMMIHSRMKSARRNCSRRSL